MDESYNELIERTDYLTEDKLYHFLVERFGNEIEIIRGKMFFKDHGYRYRPDYIIPELKLVIEYDGYHHFTDNGIITSDYVRDKNVRSLGFDVIRIPYFIQLFWMIEDYYFHKYEHKFIKECEYNEGLGYNITDFPCGFVSRKAILPGRFSDLGMRKFENILRDIVMNVDKGYECECQVILSLYYKMIYQDKPLLDCFPNFFNEKSRPNEQHIICSLNHWLGKNKYDFPQDKIDEAKEVLNSYQT